MDAERTQESKPLDASEAWQAIYAAPVFDLDPLSGRELDAIFHGEVEADLCERMLAAAARTRGALDELSARVHPLR